MDYISHGVWSFNVYHRTKVPFLAILFGVLPDTLSWVPYFFYRLFSGEAVGKPVISEIPAWVFTLYGISHSLVVAAVVFVAVRLIAGRIPIYMWAWPLHIVIDLFTHRREFLPTPFLWPVSDWHFPGISWADPWFMAINYPIMIAVLLWAISQRRKSLHRPNPAEK